MHRYILSYTLWTIYANNQMNIIALGHYCKICIYYLHQGGYVFVIVCLSVCLPVCLLATLCKNFWMDLYESFREGWQWANKQLINFGGDPDHCWDTRIVFRIRHYSEIRKLESINCAARHCRAGHALAGITIATMTSLRHQPLAEVCIVSVLLVIC